MSISIFPCPPGRLCNEKHHTKWGLMQITVSISPPKTISIRQKPLNINIINRQSVVNKCHAIVHVIMDVDFDALVTTETWLTCVDFDQKAIGSVTPEGHISSCSSNSQKMLASQYTPS